MEDLLDQLESSVKSGHYLMALYVALTLPDICGALESGNGRATGNRYKGWFNKWVSTKYDKTLTGEQCYAYRCGVLHQGRSTHDQLGYSRVMFLEPNSSMKIHRSIMNDAYVIDLETFCNDISASVREWLKESRENTNFIKNYEYFIKRHENGIPPYIVGVPVVS